VTESNLGNDGHSGRTIERYPFFLAIGGIVLTLAGFAVGRAFPAHRYQEIGASSYLFETHTGKACAPFRNSAVAPEKANAAKGDIFDQLAVSQAQGIDHSKDQVLDPNDPASVRWHDLHKQASDMIPVCGSE
jgi:hypothetical protein